MRRSWLTADAISPTAARRSLLARASAKNDTMMKATTSVTMVTSHAARAASLWPMMTTRPDAAAVSAM